MCHRAAQNYGCSFYLFMRASSCICVCVVYECEVNVNYVSAPAVLLLPPLISCRSIPVTLLVFSECYADFWHDFRFLVHFVCAAFSCIFLLMSCFVLLSRLLFLIQAHPLLSPFIRLPARPRCLRVCLITDSLQWSVYGHLLWHL